MGRTVVVVAGMLAWGLGGACAAAGGGPADDGGLPDADITTGGDDAAGPEVVVSPGGPRLFFTDLESGPGTGGEGGNGVFVTLYGAGFGAAQGTGSVTIGGGPVAAYRAWSDRRVTVQVGPASATGDIVVRSPAGDSNPLPFTVRPGAIRFVGSSGSDDGAGTFDAPWRTLAWARDHTEAGSIVYVLDGYALERHDGTGWHAAFRPDDAPGEPGRPRALVAYPGATATLGSAQAVADGGDDLQFAIRAAQGCSHWVIAGLRLRAAISAIETGGCDGWRVVGNDISCPIGDGPTGCVAFSMGEDIRFLGNDVHDTSRGRAAPASKQYHAVYFTTETNRVDVGWNHIHDNWTCHAIQFHSSPNGVREGLNQHDLVVHDNTIHGDACAGINFATVDASPGVVAAYNNVIYDVGNGPEPWDGESGSACIYVPGYTNAGPDGDGEVVVSNNTLYGCGGRGTPSSGMLFRDTPSPNLVLRLRNNIVVATGGAPYFAEWSAGADLVGGSTNLFFGAGDAPAFLSGSVQGDPLLADPAAGDFHLQAGSPGIDVGLPSAATTDHDGQPRPPGAVDLGAYEHVP